MREGAATGWRGLADSASRAALRWTRRARERLPFAAARPGRAWHADLDPRIRSSLDGEHRLLVDLGLLPGAGSLFSIGPGAGHLEVELASRYGLRLGYVEPFRGSCARFDAALAAAGLTDRLVERHEEGFQRVRLRSQYDLVLSVNSWYSLGKRPPLLQKALDARRPGGTLFVSLASEQDELRRMLQEPLQINAEDISRWARAAGFAHRVERFGAPIPMSILVEGDELTEAGRRWLGFVGQRPWSELSTDRRDRARAYVLERRAEDALFRARTALIFGPASE